MCLYVGFAFAWQCLTLASQTTLRGLGAPGADGTCSGSRTRVGTRVRGSTVTCLLSPDVVSHKMVHFDLLHEDVSLQYFIPALS